MGPPRSDSAPTEQTKQLPPTSLSSACSPETVALGGSRGPETQAHAGGSPAGWVPDTLLQPETSRLP